MNQPSESTAATEPVPRDLIHREYLDDLKCRVSPCHYKNVKGRLDRTVAALQLGNLHELQPVQVIRYRNQQRESERPTAPTARWQLTIATRTRWMDWDHRPEDPSELQCAA